MAAVHAERVMSSQNARAASNWLCQLLVRSDREVTRLASAQGGGGEEEGRVLVFSSLALTAGEKKLK